jgi:hypothetical protein
VRLRVQVKDVTGFLQALHQGEGVRLAARGSVDVVSIEDDLCDGAHLGVVEITLEELR